MAAETAPAPLALRLSFVGAGNMTSALIRGLIASKTLESSNITASSPSGGNDSLRTLGIQTTKSNAECVARADVVILAVKPVYLNAVLGGIRDHLRLDTLIISIVAGVTLDVIQQVISQQLHRQEHQAFMYVLQALSSEKGFRVIRVMPNTPSSIGQGASAFARGTTVTDADAMLVTRLFEAVGVVAQVTEPQLDAVTGLSGSGPAYVLMMIEALADGGVAAGLPRVVAQMLATQLVKGTSMMVQETKTHPAVLKDAVASPGGTTIAGIHALESGGFRGTVMSAVVAATKRSVELRGPTR